MGENQTENQEDLQSNDSSVREQPDTALPAEMETLAGF